MNTKYIDLAPRIIDYANVTDRDASVAGTLRWLDEHPDQVPGRTITESELQEVARNHESIRDLAGMLGITVVPDPGLTNLQRLSRAIRDWEEGLGADRVLARHLNALGVKAPDND